MEISIDDAIRIANIISKAPAERLSLIREVFAQAGVEIGEIEAAASMCGCGGIDSADLEIVLTKLTDDTEPHNGFYLIKPSDFNFTCVNARVSPTKARRTLARMGLLRTSENGNYSCTVWVTEKPEKRVCIYEDWQERFEKCMETE